MMKSRNRGHAQVCHICCHKAYVTSTRQITNLITERYYQCSNVECEHVFKTVTQVVETIIPPKNQANLL